MQIDFGKIVTNALSALVAAVFVGAAAIVWQAATSVDKRISDAKEDIKIQQDAIKATQQTIVPKLTAMNKTIEELRAEVRSLSKLLAEAKVLPDSTKYKSGEPIILDEFSMKINPDWDKKETERIQQQIDARQMEIYEQRIPLKK